MVSPNHPDLQAIMVKPKPDTMIFYMTTFEQVHSSNLMFHLLFSLSSAVTALGFHNLDLCTIMIMLTFAIAIWVTTKPRAKISSSSNLMKNF